MALVTEIQMEARKGNRHLAIDIYAPYLPHTLRHSIIDSGA